MRDSVVFYKSFRDAIKDLPADEQLKAYDAIFDYAFDDEEPEEKGVASMVLKFVKPQIDANNERYRNGCNGGRPSKKKPSDNQTETKPKPNDNQTETNPEPNVNDNDNENVNDNENEKIGGPLGTPGAYFPNDPELDQAFSDFVEYRRVNNKPIDIDHTKRKLWDISKGNRDDMIHLLDESMAQGWTGIYSPRERASPKKKRKGFDGERTTDYSALEEELLGKKVT